MKYIYTLSENGNPFYVGMTTNPKIRYKSHRHRLNYSPFEFELLEETEDEFMETYWIHQLTVWGFDLKNRHQSIQGYVLTEDHRRKIRENSTRGTESQRKLTSEITSTRYLDPLARLKQSDRMRLWWKERKQNGR